VASVVALGSLLALGCDKGPSEDAAAVAAAREAQARAEAELKLLKEKTAAPVPAPTPPPDPVAPQEITPAANAAPAVQAQVPANPLPDPGRIKGDLIGRSVKGGMLSKYTFQSLGEFLSFKVLNRQEAGNVAEFALDTVLKKDASSGKRCFSNLHVTYRRNAANEPWTFGDVKATTFTCE
jgi:hypothetical protein